MCRAHLKYVREYAREMRSLKPIVLHQPDTAPLPLSWFIDVA
jgi:hypothetical protein